LVRTLAVISKLKQQSPIVDIRVQVEMERLHTTQSIKYEEVMIPREVLLEILTKKTLELTQQLENNGVDMTNAMAHVRQKP